MFWTPEDLLNGLCTVADLGTPRPEQFAVVDPAPSAESAPAPSLREQLTKDALVAYRELGGVEYLKKNPALLDKVLAKSIAPEPVSVVNNIRLDDMPWITAQRHAYKFRDLAEDAEIKHGAPVLPSPGSANDPGEPVLAPPGEK
ncbi:MULTISPECIES: hypothetical protein [unclassified Variovorax]|jgi:hypothetical protein|uniref:hypothetical protein n=1 Tax=unclassified Variovorax TaxID=663243 RepID=UPI000F7EFAC5|nr:MULTISPECIES: hypothetical protein [unclassified Variovorax]RSZ47731.1 hypothetical protein EJO70_03790 [Variovorax sp. 553]RSZ48142.1 hypothetical protein EJO71_00195 [Variovorax sp. 679]